MNRTMALLLAAMLLGEPAAWPLRAAPRHAPEPWCPNLPAGGVAAQTLTRGDA